MFFTVDDTFEYIPGLPRGNLVEMGVYGANSLCKLVKAAIDYGCPFDEIYGFDSFQGLPPESPSVWNNPDWSLGAFDTRKEYGLSTIEDCIQYCTQKVVDYSGIDRVKLSFVPGFFSNSLTTELGKKCKNSCSYLNIDCDLYLSTIECLDWIFTYGILKENCLVRFDDWLYNGQFAGNNKAFYEMTKKYQISWIIISDNIYLYERQDELDS